MKTLILDNYDSFTYNLYQYVAELGGNPVVYRNDAIDIDGVRDLSVTHVIIGPGPGNPYTPGDIGIAEELIEYAFEEQIPLLGVCLGHQILAKHYGATVSRAPSPYHGKATSVRLESGSPLFAGLGREIRAMRYHSLCAEKNSIPGELKITALSEDEVVMAIEHLRRPLYGIQFHPESVGTPSGKRMIKNFLSIRRPQVQTAHDSAYDLISALVSGTLSEKEREDNFRKIVSVPLSSGLLVRAVTALFERMIPIDLSPEAIDTCGTGGSGKRTMNTSTLTAFVVAASGGKVAKHGNRSASGNCGCFDLLEKLGVHIRPTLDAERKLFEELGIVFLFAPLHHPALKFVAPIRKSFGKKTIFNLLGPLLNPAGARRQLIGTGNAFDAKLLSGALKLLDTRHSFVVSGMDGLDEISVSAPSIIHEIISKCPLQKKSYFTPSDLGLPISKPHEIEGGSVEDNAEIFLEIAKGRGRAAHRNLVLVNAAHALLLAEAGSSLTDCFLRARETLASGKVFELFRRYRDLSQEVNRRFKPPVNSPASILARKKEEIQFLPTGMAIKKNRRRLFADSLRGARTALIAEIKPVSPSHGKLIDRKAIPAMVGIFNRHAQAISVLCDAADFGGGYDLLAEVRSRTTLPLLAKEFIVDERQIDLAANNGADAVLLIADILSAEELARLALYALDLGLDVLLEVHGSGEIEKIARVAGKLSLSQKRQIVFGINNRDLRTGKVDLRTTTTLAPALREKFGDRYPIIAESGIAVPADVHGLAPFVRGFLIGTSILQSKEPGAFIPGLFNSL